MWCHPRIDFFFVAIAQLSSPVTFPGVVHEYTFARSLLGFGVVDLGAPAAQAQEVFKIGLILPMTGQSASTGKQIEAAARLFMAQNGDKVAGRKIELIVKDDGGVPDATKRMAQELVVNEKVGVLSGFGLTPLALATRTDWPRNPKPRWW